MARLVLALLVLEVVRVSTSVPTIAPPTLPVRPGPARVWLLVTATLPLLVAATVALVPPLTVDSASLALAGGVMLAVAASERWVSLTIRTGSQSHSYTLSEAPLLFGVLLLNQALLVAARVAGMVLGNQVLRRQQGFKTAFNVTQAWLETGLAIIAATTIARAPLGAGPRLLLTAVVIGVLVNTIGAGSMVTAMWAMTGELRTAPGRRALNTGVAPAVTSAVVGASTTVLWTVSPVLVLGPAAALAALTLGYRSYLTLVESNRAQAALLTFTEQVSGRGDVDATAHRVAATTKDMLTARDVGIRLTTPGGGATWLGVDDATGLALAHAFTDRDSRWADGPAGDDEIIFAQMGRDWLAVVMERDSIRDHDRRTVEMVANHAKVVLDNARSSQSLRHQVAQAHYRATHDSLTGLPNRAALLTAIADHLTGGNPFGVLLLDLNDFKKVNDALGHHAGDLVLTEITARVEPLLPDLHLFARLGGDEFAAIVEGSTEACHATAERLHEVIGRAVRIDAYEVAVGSSIGVALAPDHGADASSLLKSADLAMYEAKRRGGGTEIYGRAAGGRAMRELEISSAFREALDRGDIDVAFQPIIDLDSGSVAAVEALSRWSHPTLGRIQPDEFIAAAEQHGMIGQLTEQVLGSALRWQRLWAATGLDLQVAVNISARSLTDDALPNMVAAALRDHDVPANRLTLELTESTVVSNPEVTIANLRRLRALGVRLAVDDFGTGYSSLAYLRELPVDEIKIDKSFVMPLDSDDRTPPLLSGIINLCKEMGFELVGEGIETPAVRDRLTSMGCTRGQGFHIGRPMDGTDLLQWQAGWVRRQEIALAS